VLNTCGFVVSLLTVCCCCRYKLIDEKLQLSEYLQWTFLSCQGPMKVSEGCFRCTGSFASTAACNSLLLSLSS
jgi:hypothetical protein